MNFKERFKGRVGSINRQGDIESPNGSTIPLRVTLAPSNINSYEISHRNIKPKITKEILIEDNMIVNQKQAKENICHRKKQDCASYMNIMNNVGSTKYRLLNSMSYARNKSNVIPLKTNSMPRSRAETKPCTREKESARQYYVLGGLGANLGNKDWGLKKEKQLRMMEYGRAVIRSSKAQEISIPNCKKPIIPIKYLPVSIQEAKVRKARRLEYADHLIKHARPNCSMVSDTVLQ